MSNIIIRQELATRLKTWADAQNPSVQIAYQNVPFLKPSTPGVPWLEAQLLPNVTLNNEVSGSRKTYMGIFQVNCWGLYGNGMRVIETLAQNVIDLFPVLPKTGLVSIEQTPTAENPLFDTAGWVIVPVTIKYRMETF